MTFPHTGPGDRYGIPKATKILPMGRIMRRLKQLRILSLDRSDHGVESERSVENTDALAAAGMRGGDQNTAAIHSSAPPNYLKPDDGRPRH